MKLYVLAFVGLALAGCVAAPEIRLTDEERKLCLEAADPQSGVILISSFNVGCLEFGKLERMKGVWYRGFEESGFAEGVRTVPLTRELDGNENGEFDIWLYVPDETNFPNFELPERKGGCVRAVYLEFEGRKAVRDVPGPMQRNTPVYRVERVFGAKFVGHVNTFMRGKPYMTCTP